MTFLDLKQVDDGQLVILLSESRPAAFEEIYRRYWYKLYSIAFHHTGEHQEAEELVQDVFLSLWHRRNAVQIRHLDLYLTLAIKNQVYDCIKGRINYRKYQEYLIFQEIQQDNGNDIIQYDQLTQAVEEALNRLPEKSADIFRRSRFENQSNREIAESLHLSEKAVEYHITRTLKFLRETLRPFQSDN